MGAVTAVRLTSQPFDVQFHPSAGLLAAGLISGKVELHQYGTEESARVWKKRAHQESCRALQFMEEGAQLVSGSKDGSLAFKSVETGKTVQKRSSAHDAGINRLLSLSETTVAAGDDDGGIKVWDSRQSECCSAFHPHHDFIGDMALARPSMQLLGASGDGTLSVCNLRQNKVESVSENAEDELLSVVILKHRQKVVSGTQGGALLLYSWGHFEDCSDRFLGHPESVDAMLKVDEDTVITGSFDGIIRIVSILPNKMLGVVGSHADYPIERLALSPDSHTLASISHDRTVKLWDVSYLSEAEDSPDEDEEEPVEGATGGASDPHEGPSSSAAAPLKERPKEAEEDSDSGDGKASGPRKKKQKTGKRRNLPADPSFFKDL